MHSLITKQGAEHKYLIVLTTYVNHGDMSIYFMCTEFSLERNSPKKWGKEPRGEKKTYCLVQCEIFTACVHENFLLLNLNRHFTF